MAPVPTSASVRVRSLSSSVTLGCVTHGIHCMGSGSQDFTNSLSVPGDRVENCVTEQGMSLACFYMCVCGGGHYRGH